MHFHLIGVAGTGMSALAALLVESGHRVSGSDTAFDPPVGPYLRELGIGARVGAYDLSAWFDRVQKGDYDMAIGWSVEGPTPYPLFRWLMSEQTIVPLGQPAPANWHRHASPAVDAALTAFERTTDLSEQKRLVQSMQVAFATEAPAIPLSPNPAWGEYNTRRF